MAADACQHRCGAASAREAARPVPQAASRPPAATATCAGLPGTGHDRRVITVRTRLIVAAAWAGVRPGGFQKLTWGNRPVADDL